MANYAVEKFERDSDGKEQKVAWRQDKHVHDATLITAICKWLPQQVPGGSTWKVRVNSYDSHAGSSVPAGAIEYRG